jgi:hypothetical protein
MSRKTFDPFIEGEELDATKYNSNYGLANGLAGTVTNIAGEQVREGGVTRRVINTHIDDYVAPNLTDGRGNPWLAGVPVFQSVQVNSDHQGVGFETIKQSSVSDLEIDIQVANATEGDIVVVEFVGQGDFVQYLDKGFGDGTAVVAGDGDYWDSFAEMRFQYDIDSSGAFTSIPTPTIDGMVWRHSGLYATEAGASMSSGKLYPTRANTTFAGALTGGPGKNRSFHMSYLHPLDGTETRFQVRVQVRPGTVGTGSTPTAAVANPACRIFVGATLSAYIIRKGES